ncbi:hypothetical protein C0J52_27990 [Blattella germanica]|nr:hypothetical protein C0J52_27990 [Blattella germanica]
MVGQKLYLECVGKAAKGIRYSIVWKYPNKRKVHLSICVVRCDVKQGGTVESVDTPYIQDTVQLDIILTSHTKSPPEEETTDISKPSINDSAVHPVMAGQKLYLECVGKAAKGIRYSIVWKYPNKVLIWLLDDSEFCTIINDSYIRIGT